MKVISNAEFGGERPLFESHDLRLENVIIRAGESAIKECSNIEAVDCRFEGNYPFWHVHGFVIDRCFFDVGGRSALWYSDHLKMTNTRIDAPKMFREMRDIEIENVEINDADEVFWRCRNLNIKNLKLHGGTYPFMFSSNIRIDGLAPVLLGLYSKKLIKGEPAFEFVTEAKKFYKNCRCPIDKTKTV